MRNTGYNYVRIMTLLGLNVLFGLGSGLLTEDPAPAQQRPQGQRAPCGAHFRQRGRGLRFLSHSTAPVQPRVVLLCPRIRHLPRSPATLLRTIWYKLETNDVAGIQSIVSVIFMTSLFSAMINLVSAPPG
jgi:hypothetical protein